MSNRTLGPDAATWTPPPRTAELSFGRGRAPRMTLMAWARSQTTELGRNEQGFYRRCLTPGCRIWAGPYLDVLECKRDGVEHQHLAHDVVPARTAAR